MSAGGTAARLLFPALRWSRDTGFAHEEQVIELALRLGVGGFCIFGGEAAAVAGLTARLRSGSRIPLLIASDLERGAGQQFPQATPLPPLAAIGSLGDTAVTRRAGALTGREALALGVNWVLAPVADVDLEPRNPIVGSRSFGTDPGQVAAHVAAWIDGCRSAGALCCAKHFPGHGRTVEDSHAVLPHVDSGRAALEADLAPFRAAIAAGADALMTAHVVYHALDDATAATVSQKVLAGVARRELGFGGLMVSDALVMEGLLRAAGGSEEDAAVQALRAGCDALLYPGDLQAVAAALQRATEHGPGAARMAEALSRLDAATARAAGAGAVADATARGDDAAPAVGSPEDRAWADDVALRCVAPVAGAPRVAAAVDVVTIDDDLGGPYPPPPRDAFVAALRESGIEARAVDTATGRGSLVVAVYSDIRAWKGAPGISAAARAALHQLLAAAPEATVVFFGHRRLAPELTARHVLGAWGGEPVMQRAAARWLAGIA